MPTTPYLQGGDDAVLAVRERANLAKVVADERTLGLGVGTNDSNSFLAGLKGKEVVVILQQRHNLQRGQHVFCLEEEEGEEERAEERFGQVQPETPQKSTSCPILPLHQAAHLRLRGVDGAERHVPVGLIVNVVKKTELESQPQRVEEGLAHVVHRAVAILDAIQEAGHVDRATVKVAAAVADGNAGALLTAADVVVLVRDVRNCTRVGTDVTGKVPIFAENLAEERVGAGGHAIYGVVAAHDALGVALHNRLAEGRPVRILHGGGGEEGNGSVAGRWPDDRLVQKSGKDMPAHHERVV